MKAPAGLLLALLGAVACGGPLPAPVAPPGPLGLEASLVPERLPLGAPARLLVRLRRDPGVEAAFPPVPALLGELDGLMVDQQAVRSLPLADGASLEERQYTLRLFKTGPVQIPSLKVEGKRDGESLEAAAPGLVLEALSVLEGHGPELEEPEGPLGPQRSTWPVWPLAAGALALLVALVCWALLRRRGRPDPAPAALPPHLAALASLAQIRAWPRSDAPAVDALVVACSGVVRTYIEAAFGIHAPDRTSEEFLVEAAASRPFGEEPLRLLSGFLQECDRAKFAGWTPPRDRQEGLLTAAERFIRSTAPEGGAP